MEISLEHLADGIKHVRLTGRMDVVGTQAIDVKFAALVATGGGAVVVDMSAVSFLASIGIRTLLQNAKAVKHRGGALVILNPTSMVDEVLRSSGIAHVIPVHADMESACRAARQSAAV